MDMEVFKQVVRDFDLMEITKSPWEHRVLHHGPDCLKTENKETHLEVAKAIIPDRNIGGIYAYFKDSECLYIGKGKSLQSRIHVHMLEAESIWGADKWKDFFSQYQGKLDLYILKIGEQDFKGNQLRLIIESILTVEYNPAWLNHKFNRRL